MAVNPIATPKGGALVPPTGSWTQLGWRTGPDANFASGQNSGNTQPYDNTTGVANPFVGANFLQYGNGVSYASQTVANINRSYVIGTDDVWTSTYTASATGGWVPLVSATQPPNPQFKPYYSRQWSVPQLASTIVDVNRTPQTVNPPNGNGNLAIQFLSPLVPFAKIVCSAAFTGWATVFGYDWYGQPVQKTKVITQTAAGTFYVSIQDTAFYGLTGVYVQLTVNGAHLTDFSLQGWTGQVVPDPLTSQLYNPISWFGLPYVLKKYGHYYLYSDDGIPLSSSFTAGGNTSAPFVYPLFNPNQATLIIPGSSVPSTEQSADPRGLIACTSLQGAVISNTFTTVGYWVEGADTLNTVLADQQRYDLNTPVITLQDSNTGVISYSPNTNIPMSWEGVYGNPQYWTGIVPDKS